MYDDVVCIDGEIKTVSKDVEEFLSDLSSNIAKYNRVLKRVHRAGIKDEMIRSRLENLIALLKSYKETIEQIKDRFITDKDKFLKDIDKEDKFDFPVGMFSDVEMVLGMFK